MKKFIFYIIVPVVFIVSVCTISFAGTYKLKQNQGYLDIDGNNGSVTYWGDGRASGTNWSFISQGNNIYKISNLGNSRYKGWYLDIDGNTCNAMLTNNPGFSGTNWKLISLDNGKYRLQNMGGAKGCNGYLQNTSNGESDWDIIRQ